MNQDPFHIELAKPGEEEEILALYRKNIGTAGCTWHEEYPTMLNILEDMELKSLYCLKDAMGRILAVASAGPFNELTELTWDERMINPCELARITVTPDLQGKGIASLLLKAVISDCIRRGFDGMRFLVSKTNNNALRLYRRFGFEETGEAFLYGHEFFCYYKLLRNCD